MWRTLSVSRDRLQDVLNEIEAKGCEIREVIPDGDLNIMIIFKEPQTLNEAEK